MNIEIANRLVQLRKKSGLSQEELAAQLGISRQAVSKWERAEASPDTDNLILLSRVYGVSLDELLKTDDDVPPPEKEEPPKFQVLIHGKPVKFDAENGFNIHIGDDDDDDDDDDDRDDDDDDDVTFTDDDGRTIHVEANTGEGVKINVNRGRHEHRVESPWVDFPVTLLITIAYLVMGFVWGLWHPGWVIFLAIPILHCFIDWCRKGKRTFSAFMKDALCYPVLVTAAFLLLGFLGGWWHPAWVLFVTIPLFYGVADWIKKCSEYSKYKQEQKNKEI